MKYRTSDLDRWGAGNGGVLDSIDGDENMWEIEQRLAAQEARPDPAPGIDHFAAIGTSFYVYMTNSTSLGPYTLPVAKYTSKGDGTWQPNTNYVELDTFSVNGGLYVVNIDHTSADTFDAGANDGAGHDYYTLMFQAPGVTFPTGGGVGQIIRKTGVGDFVYNWTTQYPEGTAGKFLRQKSNTQDDVEWAVPEATEIHYTHTDTSIVPSGTVANALELLSNGTIIDSHGIPFTPTTGSGLTSTNVEDAINEVAGGSGLGRQTMWIPAAAMSPLLTHGADPGTIETTTYKNLIKTMDFDPDTSEFVQFEVVMPKSWDRGELTFKLFWSHATTTTNFTVVWKMYAATFSPSSAFDNNVNNSIFFDDSAGGTENKIIITDEAGPLEIIDAESGLGSSFGDLLIMQVSRVAESSSDTMTIDARLHGVHVYYNTATATDD